MGKDALATKKIIGLWLDDDDFPRCQKDCKEKSETHVEGGEERKRWGWSRWKSRLGVWF